MNKRIFQMASVALSAFMLLCSCALEKSDNNAKMDKVVEAVYSYIPYPEAYAQVYIEQIQYLISYAINRTFIDHAMTEFDIHKPSYVNSASPPSEYPDYPELDSIPASDIIALYKKMYGPQSEPGEDIGSLGEGFFKYKSDTDSYVYVDDGGAGTEQDCQTYRKMTGYETDDDYLYIYDIFGSLYDALLYDMTDESYEESNKKRAIIIGGECHYYFSRDYYIVEQIPEKTENGKFDRETFNEIEAQLEQGEYDDNLPTYKHTFARAEDGSYYYVKTEPVDIIEPTLYTDLWS